MTRMLDFTFIIMVRFSSKKVTNNVVIMSKAFYEAKREAARVAKQAKQREVRNSTCLLSEKLIPLYIHSPSLNLYTPLKISTFIQSIFSIGK